ncbi:TetR family transcriptional regulator [candidate division KSB1 bacterium]|nr:TetR family transcriptional regulator [candidate division KSB1 bacterium]
MKRTKKDAEITRQQLLKSAVLVFGAKGYAATRMEDIADAANVTRGAIYHHFGNKKDLFVTLFKERVDPLFDIITEALAEALSPLERIRKMLSLAFEKLVSDKEFCANQQLDFVDIKIKNDLPELKEYIHNRGETLFHMVTQLVKSGIQIGEIKETGKPEVITATIFTLISGFGFILGAQQKSPLFEASADGIIDVFIAGIKA